MTIYAITDTKKGRTGIAPTYLQTTQQICCLALTVYSSLLSVGCMKFSITCIKLLITRQACIALATYS